MKYLLIKGSMHVVGYSPDGDSMMFKAANPAMWDGLENENKEIFTEKLTKENGAVQLRLEGIDALETHFGPMPLPTPADLKSKEKEKDKEKKPKPGSYKQPEELGRIATEAFMWLVGVKKPQWRKFGKTTWVAKACFEKDGQEIWLDEKQSDHIPAYIVTSNIEKNGRPLAWVFPGDTNDADGSELTKEMLAERLEKSVNYQLLRYGLVYPYFFMTLAGKLRDKLIEAVRRALKRMDCKKDKLLKIALLQGRARFPTYGSTIEASPRESRSPTSKTSPTRWRSTRISSARSSKPGTPSKWDGTGPPCAIKAPMNSMKTIKDSKSLVYLKTATRQYLLSATRIL
ncbi:MAG: hypothetical protein H6634_06240 [Anaerolineales bacterium]|nr:hypothetical protein [Anaerolineales bacterium]